MHGLNKRRHWNNESSLSTAQEMHEYNQWARRIVLRKENKYPPKHIEDTVEFSIGPKSLSVYHYE